MKKKMNVNSLSKGIWGLLILAICAMGTLSTSSCSRKTGCPINEEAHVKPNKKGELPMGGGRTNLFPKKMRKKTRR